MCSVVFIVLKDGNALVGDTDRCVVCLLVKGVELFVSRKLLIDVSLNLSTEPVEFAAMNEGNGPGLINIWIVGTKPVVLFELLNDANILEGNWLIVVTF